MVGSSWSSSSSCTSSFGSLDDDVVCVIKPDSVGAPAVAEGSVKFLCSYGELQRKLRELCGWEAHLRCKLPMEDLDALISVTCDDDLANLLEEYDEASKDRLQSLKIRAFLFPRTPAPASSIPRSSPPSSPPSDSRPSPSAHLHRQNTSPVAAARVSLTCAPRWWAAPQASRQAQAHQSQNYDRHGLGEERPHPHPHRYLVQNGRHWQ
ncbi:unnamed protein product [Miscanthus lutarioriparius]|uniref:PB1 domain-containing protein n=1 Tax=Miscanthus lutarioriparius TaxID=422564 RepID=A0A811QM74_9POAL|nr:unnamed protein product [Miscanthus lutarioriparius]